MRQVQRDARYLLKEGYSLQFQIFSSTSKPHCSHASWQTSRFFLFCNFSQWLLPALLTSNPLRRRRNLLADLDDELAAPAPKVPRARSPFPLPLT